MTNKLFIIMTILQLKKKKKNPKLLFNYFINFFSNPILCLIIFYSTCRTLLYLVIYF